MKNKNTIFTEYESESLALEGNADYIVSKIETKNMNRNFENLIFDDYLILYPLNLLNINSFINRKGWMGKNISTQKYRIFMTSSLEKMYLAKNANKIYFGVDYISSDVKYTNANIENILEEYLFEVKHMPLKKEFDRQQMQELILRLDEIKENTSNNFKYFSKLNNDDYLNELNRIVVKYHFKEVKDVSNYKKCLYIMAIDDYKQFYVGKCEGNLKARIRKHWFAKMIPNRQLWRGGYKYSKLKIDNFKIYDSKRIFICEDIDAIIKENNIEANNEKITNSNTFKFIHFEKMKDIDKAERVVINNCTCKFCLSDRPSLLNDPYYAFMENRLQTSKDNLLIKHYVEYYYLGH